MVGSTQLIDTFLNKYMLALFTAVVTGVISYIAGVRLEERKHRKALKQLSWDMNVDSSLVEVKDELRERVQVQYGGEVVKSLTTVTFRITNTGGAAVIDEFVRFAFPSRARMLEVALDPVPEPELDVAEVTDEATPAGSRRFRIGHLEPGQDVQFRFMSDGGDWANWDGIHPKNEEGGVDFQRRDISRTKEDQEHLRPFLVQGALLVLVQLSLALTLGIYLDGIIQLIRIVVTLLLSGLMLSHLVPVARLVEQIVVRYAMRGSESNHNATHGQVHGHVVQISSLRGKFSFDSGSVEDEKNGGESKNEVGS